MKASNRKQLRFVLRKYLIPKWAKVPVDSINAERVNQWVGEKELSHLSPVTIRNIVRTLQFALGRKFGKGKINYPSQVEEEQEARCFTSAEVAAIMAAASGTHKVLFTLAAESGMRAGELYGLRVEDIDFERSIVKVRRSMWEGAAQAPKSTNACRAIDVQPYVTEMLKAHLAGRTEGLVFMSRRRTPLRNTTIVGKHLHPLLRRLNLARGGMHAFRHFRVSFLVQNETPVEIIKKWIGHGSEEMIRLYTHLHPTYRKQIMAKLPVVCPVCLPQQPQAIM